jgi:hypothetical protein
MEGLAHNLLQWFLCGVQGWFSADADTISLKCWDHASFIHQKFRYCMASSNLTRCIKGEFYIFKMNGKTRSVQWQTVES